MARGLLRHLKSLNSTRLYLLAKPSEGTTFSKDCLVTLRELNSAADFVSFYEDMLPYVQTPELVLFQRETIFSKLVSGLQMKARLSPEPILRLIAALSGDLSKDFIPCSNFLPRVVNSLVILLKNGGEKDPELIAQIFTSWSKIMYYLQYYLICDIERILRDTLELRYYPNDYVNEKMSESMMSSLLRQAGASQLQKGIKLILSEVSEQPERAARAGFLYYDMILLQLQS